MNLLDIFVTGMENCRAFLPCNSSRSCR